MIEPKAEFYGAMEFLRKHSVNSFIEIGVKHGESFKLWAQHFEGIKIGIDVDPFPLELKIFPHVSGICADSHDLFTVERVKEILKGRTVDWLFIDGDHETEAVIRDYTYYRSFVTPGGFIGFHDIDNISHKGIRLFWDSLEGEKIEICGIGIKRWLGVVPGFQLTPKGVMT